MIHRFVILVAIVALLVMTSGAFVRNAERPSGQAQAMLSENTHRALGLVLAALTLGLAIWISAVDPKLRLLVWGCVAILLTDAALRWQGPVGAALGIPHALLAHLYLVGLVAIAVFTSPSWHRDPELVDGAKWPALRTLAAVTPFAVGVQILLGAAYRHEAIGVLYHIAGAMVAVLMTMIASVAVLQTFPKHRDLYRAASGLLTIVLIQVCLGIASLVMPLLDAESTLWYSIATASHLVVGALTLAASVVLALQVRRNVAPAAQSAK